MLEKNGWMVVLLAGVIALTGCSSNGGDGGQTTGGDAGSQTSEDSGGSDEDSGGSDQDASQTAVNYYKHVKPILETNCTNCHTAGGIAPFELDSYEKAKPMAGGMVAALESGSMPPWPPQEGCGEFQHTRSVTADEIATIRQWTEAGTPEGDPANAVDGQPETVELGEPDFVADPGFEYQGNPPNGGIDDYHCFVIDPQLSEDKFLRAFESVPGNDAIVHHVLLYAADSSQDSRLQQLEDEDTSSQGYTCFGGPRVSDPTLLGGWVPGTVPLDFGEGKGIRIEAGSKLVMQVHYNMLNDSEGTDRTTINLHYTDGQPDTELAMLPLAETNLDIQAGEANAVETASVSLPISVDLYGVVPHMHLLGKSINVKYTQGGEETCLVDIPEWDFDWQGFYLYKEPVTIPGGADVQLTCTFDNSPENQPEGRTPRDVTWGEGTFDEMCLNYVIIRRPPGL